MSTHEELEIALRAARSALPFADLLAGRYVDIVANLRSGHDERALIALGDSTADLEDFLAFLVLIVDMVSEQDPRGGRAIRDYRERLVGILEALQPALGHVDLVEVADALEDDLIPSLRDYRALDASVQSALAPAA